MNHDSPPRPGSFLRAADQRTVAVLVASCLMLIVLNLCLQGYHRGQLIEIDDAPPLETTFSIDLNRGAWSEFLLLPGIGETLARRIVQNREEHGAFASVEDLQRVKGIGPKTIRRIGEWLRVSAEDHPSHD